MKIERMKRWVIAMLLCGLCHIGAFAYGYDKNAQSQNWGYQPVYNTVYATPSYRFQTTSAYIHASGGGEYNGMMPGNNGPRRSYAWDEVDDEDPIGTVPDPVPVGDMPWLLMLLLLTGYIAFRYHRQRKAHTLG